MSNKVQVIFFLVTIKPLVKFQTQNRDLFCWWGRAGIYLQRTCRTQTTKTLLIVAARDTAPSAAGQGWECHNDGVQIIPSVAKSIALLPCLMRILFFLSYLLFLPNGTARLRSSRRHGAAFTVVPSSRTPATKTQQTWRVACSHPHDCKIPELRSALFLPTFQLTAESCSGIFPVPLKHISSSSQTGLLY